MNYMKIVTITMELVIDDDISEDYDSIADYLNDKLFLDPEFFGGFVPENISGVINCVE
jgi:hypothetical protein